MVISVCGCLLSLMWLSVLLVVVIYVYAIGFMQMYRDSLEGGKVPINELKTVNDLYGSLGSAMLTLFMAISGGTDWKECLFPIMNLSQAYGYLFLFYIVFIIFGVLNVVTGVFVDKALQIAGVDKEFVILEEMQRRHEDMHELQDFFQSVDEDCDGIITKEELRCCMGDSWLQGYLATMDIESNAMENLFNLLDLRGTGALSIQDFVAGCMKVRGNAKAVDLFAMTYEAKERHKIVSEFMEFMEDRLEEIEQRLSPSCEAADEKGCCQSNEPVCAI